MKNVDQVENGYGPMTNIRQFLVKYLFILETEVSQFQIESSRISTYVQELCKVHLVLHICWFFVTFYLWCLKAAYL
jgi:hypothetical protein